MVRTRQLHLALIVILIFGACSWATPIRPDLQKLLKQDQRPRRFSPARAGWNGPEMQPRRSVLNPTLEAYGPAATAKQNRDALLTAIIPDPKAVIAIGGLIVLLRILRVQKQKQKNAAVIAMPRPPEEEEEERQAA